MGLLLLNFKCLIKVEGCSEMAHALSNTNPIHFTKKCDLEIGLKLTKVTMGLPLSKINLSI